jgi:hypothetical protein
VDFICQVPNLICYQLLIIQDSVDRRVDLSAALLVDSLVVYLVVLMDLTMAEYLV